MKFLLSSLLMLAGWQSALALEPENPKSHCERFLNGDPQINCEKRMEVLKPDWYLAAACSRTFDDKIFYQCLGTKGAVSPKLLESCAGDLEDSERLNCVRKSVVTADRAFQRSDRQPASGKPPGPKKQKTGH